MAFAERTAVPVDRTRVQIEALCAKHKCVQYGSAVDYEQRTARIQFKAYNRIVRFELLLPEARQEQKVRARWRALFLVIKAKLEAVESQISTFEQEFMPFIVLPNDQTVGAAVSPLIEAAYKDGKMPRQLLQIGDGK